MTWWCLGWYLDLDNSKEKDLLLAAAVTTALVFPWTKVAIMPINNILMDGDLPKQKGDAWAVEMMKKWDRVHSVRTLVSFVAGSCIAAYWIKKTL